MLFEGESPEFGACVLTPSSEYGLVGRVEDHDICLHGLNAAISFSKGAKSDQGMFERGHDMTHGGGGLD